jgi:alpha-D-ribose 1-methylphosphonate 5-triphosphate synthase subunit PhnI
MYVAIKGGEAAIANAHRILADRRRGDRSLPSITIEQVVEQLGLAVDRVMAEASLYDRSLAALAVRQARGDMIEAIFILRAYRTTLPRFGSSEPIDTAGMKIERRVSATYKDLPGGQLLGPTFDYTHRLLDPSLIGEDAVAEPTLKEAGDEVMRVSDILDGEGLIEGDGEMPEGHLAGDLTREPMEFPMPAATKASSSRSPIPPSAAMGAPTLSSARSASARSRSNSTCRNWVSPSR